MKNLTIGSFLFILSIGRFIFTEKYFETTFIVSLLGLFFLFVGAAQIISELKKIKP